MIPGLQSKISESVVASADTIFAKTDFVRITGAVAINTILSPLMGSGLMINIVAVDGGAIVLGTTGNILVGLTMAQNRPYTMFWSKTVGKWYIGATNP